MELGFDHDLERKKLLEWCSTLMNKEGEELVMMGQLISFAGSLALGELRRKLQDEKESTAVMYLLKAMADGYGDCIKGGVGEGEGEVPKVIGWSEGQKVTLDAVNKLMLLRDLLKDLKLQHLVKLTEVCIPERQPELETAEEYSSRRLILLQRLFHNLSSESLRSLHSEISLFSMSRPVDLSEAYFDNQEEAELSNLLRRVTLPPELSMMYQPLLMTLKLPLDSLFSLSSTISSLLPPQVPLLVKFLLHVSDPNDLLFFRKLFVDDNEFENYYGDELLPDLLEQEDTQPGIQHGLKMEFLEQPSPCCVYKRNLRPGPRVRIRGTCPPELVGKLSIRPAVIRCDTNQELAPEHLKGGAMQKATINKPMIFNKLKIMLTSNRMADSLVRVKFELLTEDSAGKMRVLDELDTHPIDVKSHSSQLPKAKIIEVIPSKGSTRGGTKVVIIGSGFIQQPTTRIRFGDQLVAPSFFHGTNNATIICFTPRHGAGSVKVSVTNDGKKFSPESVDFVFEEEQAFIEEPKVTSVPDPKSNFDSMFGSNNFAELGKSTQLDSLFGSSSLQFFASSGMLQGVQQVLSSCSSSKEKIAKLSSRDVTGSTPLAWAVRCGQQHVVEELLSNGANPNICDSRGVTPLFDAVERGDIRMTRLLLEVGADPNRGRYRDMSSALHRATLSDSTPNEGGGGEGNNHPCLISLLIEYGAHTEEKDTSGESPLWWCIREGNLNGLRQLLKLGANPNSRDISYSTPLHLAVSLGNVDAVSILINNKASISAQDQEGSSPLHEAVSSGSFGAARLLLQAGADPLSRDASQSLPFMLHPLARKAFLASSPSSSSSLDPSLSSSDDSPNQIPASLFPTQSKHLMTTLAGHMRELSVAVQ